MKKIIVVLCVMLIVLSGCSNNEADNFIKFASTENHTDESRQILINRLEENGIDWRLDENNNLLIKESDSKKATVCCT